MTGGRLLDVRALATRLGVATETIARYRHRGTLPPPDQMLGRSPGWREETIDAWIPTRPGRGRRAFKSKSGT